MHIIITGATGFIGSYVACEAVIRGHRITAVARSQSKGSLYAVTGVDWFNWDLSASNLPNLSALNVDCVIHLAASMGGIREEQERTMIGGTARLLAAAGQAGIGKLIGVSSIGVLDYPVLRPMSVVDETAAVANCPGIMGQYASIKARQEEMLRAYGQDGAARCVMLRPGLVYDDTRLISAHAGILKGPVRWLIAHEGQVPTVEVRGLARAIVDAAERALPDKTVLHLVDDHLPSQSAYIEGLRRRGLLAGGSMMVSWRVAFCIALMARLGLSAVGLRAKVPEALLPHSFASRFKPFRYSNTRAKELLGWVPAAQFQ